MATQAEINSIFPQMMDNFQADKAGDLNATIAFELSGDNGGNYWVKIDNGAVTHGDGETDADMTVKAAADDFYQIATGGMNPMQAFMAGKIKVTDMSLGMKMMSIFQLG